MAIHACTDVTGFGLAGHGYQMAKASGVSLRLQHQNVPVFSLARKSLEDGNLTKAHRSNHEYTAQHIFFHDHSEHERNLYFDPQTSGGLLLSVSPSVAASIVISLRSYFPGTAIIGTVVPEASHHVLVE
jgi:selenide,water dikinase